jgi:uncharacterized protein YjiS (DUF1127 family)
VNWIVRYYKYLITWRKHRQVIKELNQLTDAELRDIGINRGDIDRLVWLQEDKDARGDSE